jgi:hypothetical protein
LEKKSIAVLVPFSHCFLQEETTKNPVILSSYATAQKEKHWEDMVAIQN